MSMKAEISSDDFFGRKSPFNQKNMKRISIKYPVQRRLEADSSGSTLQQFKVSQEHEKRTDHSSASFSRRTKCEDSDRMEEDNHAAEEATQEIHVLLEDWRMLCKGSPSSHPTSQGFRRRTSLKMISTPIFSDSSTSSVAGQKMQSTGNSATRRPRKEKRQGGMNQPERKAVCSSACERRQRKDDREGTTNPSEFFSLPDPAKLRDQEWCQLLNVQSRQHKETRKGFLNRRVLTLLREQAFLEESGSALNRALSDEFCNWLLHSPGSQLSPLPSTPAWQVMGELLMAGVILPNQPRLQSQPPSDNKQDVFFSKQDRNGNSPLEESFTVIEEEVMRWKMERFGNEGNQGPRTVSTADGDALVDAILQMISNMLFPGGVEALWLWLHLAKYLHHRYGLPVLSVLPWHPYLLIRSISEIESSLLCVAQLMGMTPRQASRVVGRDMQVVMKPALELKHDWEELMDILPTQGRPEVLASWVALTPRLLSLSPNEVCVKWDRLRGLAGRHKIWEDELSEVDPGLFGKMLVVAHGQLDILEWFSHMGLHQQVGIEQALFYEPRLFMEDYGDMFQEYRQERTLISEVMRDAFFGRDGTPWEEEVTRLREVLVNKTFASVYCQLCPEAKAHDVLDR
ncbi:hypothetical protein CEUSTIGMA_g10327.t1 [Chlamydomonas eustigma]|uniref:Uncharacterized protein n=1 Tax=Chlamydomonas eustigma TaxID=1157962 RepID=A0A250XIJ2_9CHLO|nr:hypothetical protein CEUSTIGMA_g10327.t1 [Chlamydomonas eustigma]|eukprot:GAX82901.1 hypothetical protein CEUSTIGMA_g10327.t1 [Chlamydomonas eustigma]